MEGYDSDSYDYFAIVNANGKILASSDIKYERLSQLTNYNADEFAATTEYSSQEVNVDGAKFLMVVGAVQGEYESDLMVVGLRSYDAALVGMKAFQSKVLIFLLCDAIITIICFFALVLMFVNHNDFLRDYKKTTKDKYVVFCDLLGNVTDANNVFFDSFNKCNLFERMTLYAEGSTVKSGDSIVVEITNKTDNKRLLNFFVSRISKGFKLVGVDATELFERSNAGVLTHANLSRKDLIAQFNIVHAKANRLLLGIIDITNLKNLDLMFGRAFAEKIYEMVAERINKRFGRFYEMPGEKIGVLVEENRQIDYALKDMLGNFDFFNQAALIDDNLVNITCKGGFAIQDGVMEDQSFEYLESCAEGALKRSSKEERVHFYVYHESQKKLYAKLIDIKQMLANNNFEMEFQPQVDIKTGRTFGFEALFRIKKNLSIEVDIFSLITYAERTGNMILLGDFIFNEGMKFAKSIEGKGVHVSLNVSPVQLMQAGFVENFLKIYRKYDLLPSSISIEITESFLMTTFDETLKKLEILQQNGIDIHLDDFGVSYSSLLYLKKLPISAIKIDREFIMDITKNQYSKTITQTIVQICKQLDKICISEGVETEDQRVILQELGVDVVQGYLTGKSMSADKARQVIK